MDATRAMPLTEAPAGRRVSPGLSARGPSAGDGWGRVGGRGNRS